MNDEDVAWLVRIGLNNEEIIYMPTTTVARTAVGFPGMDIAVASSLLIVAVRKDAHESILCTLMLR